MVRPRKVSPQQLNALVGYMEQHRDLALNRLVHTPQGHAAVTRLWLQIATKLNAIGNGVHKTPKEWKIYWNELKYRSKKKASILRTHARGTGGGPSNLTESESRIVDILSTVAVEGNHSVQIPLSIQCQPELIQSDTNMVECDVIVQEDEEVNPSAAALDNIQVEGSNESIEQSEGPERQQPDDHVEDPPHRPTPRNRTASMPSWALEMERRHTAALESIGNNLSNLSNTLSSIHVQLTRLIDHFVNR